MWAFKKTNKQRSSLWISIKDQGRGLSLLAGYPGSGGGGEDMRVRTSGMFHSTLRALDPSRERTG